MKCLVVGLMALSIGPIALAQTSAKTKSLSPEEIRVVLEDTLSITMHEIEDIPQEPTERTPETLEKYAKDTNHFLCNTANLARSSLNKIEVSVVVRDLAKNELEGSYFLGIPKNFEEINANKKLYIEQVAHRVSAENKGIPQRELLKKVDALTQGFPGENQIAQAQLILSSMVCTDEKVQSASLKGIEGLTSLVRDNFFRIEESMTKLESLLSLEEK